MLKNEKSYFECHYCKKKSYDRRNCGYCDQFPPKGWVHEKDGGVSKPSFRYFRENDKTTTDRSDVVWETLTKEQVIEILKIYYARHGCDWNAHDFEFVIKDNELIGVQRIKR